MNTNDHLSKLADYEFVRQLMKAPLLDQEEEKRLAIAWRDHKDEEAMHKLVQSFSRLVVSIAIRFRYYGVSLSDLIQEGNIGLLCAAERFDPERNVRFSTYAKWWIRATIQDYVLRNWSIVRAGSTSAQKQLFFNLKRLKQQLLGIANELLSMEDKKQIALTLQVSLKDVEDMEKRLLTQDLSLSAPVNDYMDQEWQEFIPDERPDPEITTSTAKNAISQKEILKEALEKLDERERYVVTHRRLMDNPFTLEELGKNLNVSKERIRQIEARALRKMRHVLLHDINKVREIL